MTLDLPWPPSANTIWRNVGRKTLLSAAARSYRQLVSIKLRQAGWTSAATMTGRLKVHITASPPDKRRRDLDNLHKAVLDALQAAGLYADDGQIDDLRIVRHQQTTAGRLLVTVEEIDYSH